MIPYSPLRNPLYRPSPLGVPLGGLRGLCPADLGLLNGSRPLCNHQGGGFGFSPLAHNHGCGGHSGCGAHSHEHHHCHGDRRGRDYSPFNSNSRSRSRSRSRDRGCSHSHSSSRILSSLYDRRSSLLSSNSFIIPVFSETRDRCCPQEHEFRISMSWSIRDLEDNLARELRSRVNDLDFYVMTRVDGEMRLSSAVVSVDELMRYYRDERIDYLIVVERR